MVSNETVSIGRLTRRLEDLPPQVPTPQATYGVHRAQTELGLRHLLWQARGAPIIAVLPEELARRIRQAPDLLRRARNQRVHSLQVTGVLEVTLGVRVVGAEPPWLQQLALDHVDRLTEEMRRRTLPTVVDRRRLTELLIDACVGEQVRSRAPAELLAGWVRERPAKATTCGRGSRSTATRNGPMRSLG